MWRGRRQPIEEENRIVNDVERSRRRTMERAVRLLAAKPRSVRELEERLLEKMWTNAEIVEYVIEKLKDHNFLNDEQYAHDLALSTLRQKPQGKRRLQQSMSLKKLDREIAMRAVENAFEQISESEQIDIAIDKYIHTRGAPQTIVQSKRLCDFLLRRGFDYGLIRDKVRSLGARVLDEIDGN